MRMDGKVIIVAINHIHIEVRLSVSRILGVIILINGTAES